MHEFCILIRCYIVQTRCLKNVYLRTEFSEYVQIYISSVETEKKIIKLKIIKLKGIN